MSWLLELVSYLLAQLERQRFEARIESCSSSTIIQKIGFVLIRFR